MHACIHTYMHTYIHTYIATQQPHLISCPLPGVALLLCCNLLPTILFSFPLSLLPPILFSFPPCLFTLFPPLIVSPLPLPIKVTLLQS